MCYRYVVCLRQTQTTPLMIAARANHCALVEMLLEDSVILVKLNSQNNVFFACCVVCTTISISFVVIEW